MIYIHVLITTIFTCAQTYCDLFNRRPIKCGDIIRLEHVVTKKNLHSHLVSSPLTGKQEVSAYGDNKGEGDTGDNWMLICHTDFWERDDTIMLKHIDTEK